MFQWSWGGVPHRSWPTLVCCMSLWRDWLAGTSPTTWWWSTIFWTPQNHPISKSRLRDGRRKGGVLMRRRLLYVMTTIGYRGATTTTAVFLPVFKLAWNYDWIIVAALLIRDTESAYFARDFYRTRFKIYIWCEGSINFESTLVNSAKEWHVKHKSQTVSGVAEFFYSGNCIHRPVIAERVGIEEQEKVKNWKEEKCHDSHPHAGMVSRGVICFRELWRRQSSHHAQS